jgi:transcriptional regulator with GAF, ATPase, and Fis domain
MPSQLVGISGEVAGLNWALDEELVVLGRDPKAEIAVTDPKVSWRHLSIERKGGRYLLADLKSLNGTVVNGERVREKLLDAGDQIVAGGVTLVYSDAAGPEDAHRVLLESCTLLLLFRALGDAPNERITNQLSALIAGFTGAAEAYVHLRPWEAEKAWAGVIERAREEGVAEPVGGRAGAALYIGGEFAGALAVRFDSGYDAAAVASQLSAIATLGSVALESQRRIEVLQTENSRLRERLGEPGEPVGRSAGWTRLMELARRVSAQDTTVLVLGESGTGKEVVAQAVHRMSPRSAQPFVAINCAVLNENLMESELFGHEKGAFTGADSVRKGKLEVAAGGTVFLDEVGELAPNLQAKLLRVLQQREFERLGSHVKIRLEARLVAATNRDLAAEVKAGRFREDLYHRLNVVALRTPALRDRPEDLPLLAEHFARRAAVRCKRAVEGFSGEALEAMQRYGWPGNVRELENAIERAVVLGGGSRIELEDLPESLLEEPVKPEAAYQGALSDARKSAIVQAWRKANGDYREAARLLEMHPNSLLRAIKNLGLRPLLR